MQLCDEVAFEGCAMEEEARIEGVQGGARRGPGRWRQAFPSFVDSITRGSAHDVQSYIVLSSSPSKEGC